QDQPSSEQRRRRGAAAQTHARILRLLRLAFVGARPLAARAARENISGRALRQIGARSAPEKSDRGKPETGSRLPPRRGTGELRTAVRNGVAASTHRRTG